MKHPILPRATVARTALAWACATLVAGVTPAQAVEVTYDFAGYTNIGGESHNFTGQWVFENAAVGTTTYANNSVVQGFTTVYAGALRSLHITLDNGEQVVSGPGNLQLNNIQQAEAGAPVPVDLTLQAWGGSTSGTIAGYSVFNMYLAFLPVAPNFSWDALDRYFRGNAEQMLSDNPSLLPANINPRLTGTALPEDVLTVFNGGVFLGTNHGLTNTVNTVSAMSLATTPAVPEPATWGLMGAGMLLLGHRVRRQRG